MLLLLALAGCSAPHLGCRIGTHRTALGPGLALDPWAPTLADKLRAGLPAVCAGRFEF